MWPCKSIDMSWDDWLYATEVALDPEDRDVAATRVAALWGPADNFLPTLTLRSAFDLWLRASAFEPGEVLFSAVNVPAMAEVARLHRLVPVGVDIDPETTAPSPEALEKAIDSRTRAIVIAHLFGARLDLAPYLEIARRHGVPLVEDCAQAYAGPEWAGHAESDIALFSFGPMKTATALGGGIARVKDHTVLDTMREIHAVDPIEADNARLKRVVTFGLIKALSAPTPFGIVCALAKAAGRDIEALAHEMTQSVPGADLAEEIRVQPGGALLQLMERRLAEHVRPVERRVAPGRLLHERLGPTVSVPTRGAQPHGYWMVPVLYTDPSGLKRHLEDEGFFAMSPRLSVVGGKGAGAHHLVRNGVCVPFDPEIPEDELERLAEAVRRAPPASPRALPAPD